MINTIADYLVVDLSNCPWRRNNCFGKSPNDLMSVKNQQDAINMRLRIPQRVT